MADESNPGTAHSGTVGHWNVAAVDEAVDVDAEAFRHSLALVTRSRRLLSKLSQACIVRVRHLSWAMYSTTICLREQSNRYIINHHLNYS